MSSPFYHFQSQFNNASIQNQNSNFKDNLSLQKFNMSPNFDPNLKLDSNRTMKQTRTTQANILSQRYHIVQNDKNQKINSILSPINSKIITLTDQGNQNSIAYQNSLINNFNYQLNSNQRINSINKNGKISFKNDNISSIPQRNSFDQVSSFTPQQRFTQTVPYFNQFNITKQPLKANQNRNFATNQDTYREVQVQRPEYLKIYNTKNQYVRNVGAQQDPIQYINQKKSICSKILPILGGICLLLLASGTIYGIGRLTGLWGGQSYMTNSDISKNYLTTNGINNLMSNNIQTTQYNVDRIANGFVSNQIQDGEVSPDTSNNFISNFNTTSQKYQTKTNNISDNNINSNTQTNQLIKENITMQVNNSNLVNQLFQPTSVLPQLSQQKNDASQTVESANSKQSSTQYLSPSVVTVIQPTTVPEVITPAESIKTYQQTRKIINDILNKNTESVPQNFRTSLTDQIMGQIEQTVPLNYRYTSTIQTITNKHLQTFKLKHS